jgi:hypothetical protein
MNPLFEAALEVQRFFEERRWRFCFIGGLAVIRWGEPRATADVDVTLLTGLGREETYLTALLGRFGARRPDAADFALNSRVVLLEASNRVPVDVALAGFPFEESMVDRASPFAFAPGCRLVTCAAEDLVVLKAFAGRDLDWGDVTSILRRQRKGLNRPFVFEQLACLCELREDAAPLDRLKALWEAET